jgi:hypothetical protein
MAENEVQDPGARQRKRWLATLLDRMTAPADVMRQFLDAENQNATLGSAAEAGVRDLLRVVLPQRLAVTSGFLREPGRSLAEKNTEGTISPQTDVIIYDGSQATPLHSIGGIEIVAAPDVLGIVEVKDAENGSGDLASATGEKGALGHTSRLATYSPYAFRAIVLFRGKLHKPKEDADKTPDEDRKAPETEVELAQRLIRAANLQSYQAPHVVYCSSCATGNDEDGGYIAVYDFFAKKICIQEYPGDRTSALAAFLRIVTGFFAAKSLISPSLHLDLLPAKPEREMAEVSTADAEPAFASLHQSLLDRRAREEQATFYKLFVDLLKQEEGASGRSHVVTGRDAAGLPTAGFIVLVTRPTQATTTSAAFFYLDAAGVFVCTDASSEEGERWIIQEEAVAAYVRRALQESNRDYNVVRRAPTQQTETEAVAEGPERPVEETR